MLTYDAALTKLGNKDRIKLATATWLERGMVYWMDPETGQHGFNPMSDSAVLMKGSTIEVVYHDTVIVAIHPDDTYTLATGGWYSKTTKARIEEYAPVRLTGPCRTNMSWEHQHEARPCGIFGYSRDPIYGGPWTLGFCNANDAYRWKTTAEFSEGMTVNGIGQDVDHLSPEVAR